MNTQLIGRSIIGFKPGRENEKTFSGFDPQTGEAVAPLFYSAQTEDLENAVGLAEKAGTEYGKTSGIKKAAFLRRIAENIELLGDQLIRRATIETGLPNARFQGERGRTCGQLRMFADLIEEGSWVDARIDRADPNRAPLAKPDVRSMRRPLGPVAIFCASNFPLAFSVAGGDTASALAAGCPVVVNANKAHPGTAELVGQAISEAVKKCGLPEGVFSLLFSADYIIGQELVGHPAICAVGFTGSRAGGKALLEIASGRVVPIPVFAEMSSINPTFILPGALAENFSAIAEGLHNSFNLGFGQFCTKPGIVVMPENKNLERFTELLTDLTKRTSAAPLLTNEISKSYRTGIQERSVIAKAVSGKYDPNGFFVSPTYFQTDVQTFLANTDLSREIFGPTTVLIRSGKREELLALARSLEGQLTASVHGTEEDLSEFADLVEILETKVGRIIFNGFPTGVEVCPAMVHGGPFPSTSDGRSTSVGTRAIERYTRPVCYQDFPEKALPLELRDENLLEIWRLVDGQFGKDR